MSAQEFGEWKVIFSCEQLHPAVERQRHAQLLAAAANGPLTRNDRRRFSTSDFDPGDGWAAIEQHTKPAVVVTRAQRKAQIDAINKRIQG